MTTIRPPLRLAVYIGSRICWEFRKSVTRLGIWGSLSIVGMPLLQEWRIHLTILCSATSCWDRSGEVRLWSTISKFLIERGKAPVKSRTNSSTKVWRRWSTGSGSVRIETESCKGRRAKKVSNPMLAQLPSPDLAKVPQSANVVDPRNPRRKGFATSAILGKRAHIVMSHQIKVRERKGKGRERSRSPSKGKQKKMSREEMAKIPCAYFARGSCKRGDKCYYKHDTAAAPAKEKHKPRPNSPAAKKESKKSAVCVQHACIAKSLPGLRSSPSRERKAQQKRVRFNLKPQIIKVTAVGEQCKLADKSRRYTKVNPDASTVPASSKKEQHLAQVHARQLWEAIRVFDREKPVCKFLCDEPSLTCKHCRRVSGPVMLCKVPIDHGVTPSATTPVQTGNKVSWLVDSGSEQDLISKSMLRQVNASECKPAPNPVTLTTANGFTEATEVADVRIKSLLEKFPTVCVGTNTSGFVCRHSVHDSRLQLCLASGWIAHPHSARRKGDRVEDRRVCPSPWWFV